MTKITFNNGIYKITNSEYHSANGVSRSALIHFKRSPLHFYYKYIQPQPVVEESSSAMLLGGIVHTLVLEPETFDKNYVVTPLVDRRTKAGKEIYAKCIENAANKEVISQLLLDQAFMISESVKELLRHEGLLSQVACNNNIEESIFFDYDGIQYKCRPDSRFGSTVFDLKTTNDARPHAFKSSAYNYGYYLQAAMTQLALDSIGITMSKFACIVVEKDAPFATGIYLFDNEAIDFGLAIFQSLHKRLKVCIENNEFPAFGVQHLGIPGIAKFDECMLEE